MLTGGGARAAYQVGLLRCLGQLAPDFHFDIITGTSAGAINASFLASHPGTMAEAASELSDIWGQLDFDNVFQTGSIALTRNLGRWAMRLMSGGLHPASKARSLLDTAPLRRLLSDLMTTVDGEIVGIANNIEAGRLSAIALTTLDYGTGRTVTWVQGSDIETWERPHRRSVKTRISTEHVMASAALPLLFPAIRLGNAWYGDGGVRLSAPLAPAIHLGADRIIAVSTRYSRSFEEADQALITGYPPPAQVLGTVLNSLFLDVVEQDALHLDRLNNLIRQLPSEQRGLVRPVELLALKPSKDLGRLAASYEHRLPSAFRFLTRGLGTRDTLSPDLLSLLMFQPDYLEELMAIGEADAEGLKGKISALLNGSLPPEDC